MLKKEKYKNVYLVFDNNLDDVDENNLLMCGSKKWDMYFSEIKNKNKVDYEKSENVELVEFDNKNEMFDFWDSLKNSKKIDWSVEHKKPCLLKYI